MLFRSDQIRPSPFQARREFSEQELAALAQSIRENGLLQPISVRKVSDGGYELVAGERRLRACRLAKMNTMPAIFAGLLIICVLIAARKVYEKMKRKSGERRYG